MGVLAPLAALAGLTWSVALALVLTTWGPAISVWLAASLYGPNTTTWELAGLTLSADRVLFAWFVFFAATRFLLKPHRLGWLRRDPVLWMALGLTALAAVQIALIPWGPTASEDMPPAFRLAYVLVMPLALYVAVAAEPRCDRWPMRLLLVLWLFGVYLAVTAVAEQMGWHAIVFPRHILRPRELYLGRPVGPFMSTPLLGTTLCVALAAAVCVARRRRGPLRLAASASLPVIVVAIGLTQTRSVWLGAIAVGGLLVMLGARRSLRYGLLTLAGVAACIGAVVAGAYLVNPNRMEGAQLVEFSFKQRLALLDGALTLFVQRPIFGWGFGQFERAVVAHVGGGLLGFWATGAAEGLSSHNLPLRFLAETGLVGVTLWMGMLWVWWRRAWQCLRGDHDRHTIGLLFMAALLAYLAEAMFHDPSFQPAGNLMMGLLAGAVSRLWHDERTGSGNAATNRLGLRQRPVHAARAGWPAPV